MHYHAGGSGAEPTDRCSLSFCPHFLSNLTAATLSCTTFYKYHITGYLQSLLLKAYPQICSQYLATDTSFRSALTQPVFLTSQHACLFFPFFFSMLSIYLTKQMRRLNHFEGIHRIKIICQSCHSISRRGNTVPIGPECLCSVRCMGEPKCWDIKLLFHADSRTLNLSNYARCGHTSCSYHRFERV